METADSVIKSALEEIIVQASEAPIQPPQAQAAIKYMNRMMSAFAVSGINLGYTTVTSLGDDITIPDGAVEGLVLNLAIRLAPQYDRPVGPALVDNAKGGKKAMLKLAVNIGPTQYPSTLPRGSGNEDRTFDDHFYPEPDDAITTEQSGFISVESETEL